MADPMPDPMAKRGRRAAATALRREKRPGDATAMGRHLVGLSAAIRERVAERLLARGHDLSPSATQVVPNLPVQGLGLSELAARLRLTLQRTGQVLRQLEADGYVERVPDARDGRAKRVVYSRRGLALVRDIDAVTDALRREFEAMLGPGRFGRLCRILVFSFAVSCKKKPEEVPPPPLPQAQEQPKVEKVEPPVVQEPQLTEEEIFRQKTLDQINREKPLGTIYFDYDKALIRDDARPTLDMNASWLKKFRTVKILVEGHCDERGTEDYNLALGEKRAKSAQDYLLTLGIGADRIKIISYGKSQPINPGHDEAAWQMNRRAQFLVIEK